jgi:rhamnosyltransferase
MKKALSVGIVIPTLNPGQILEQNLEIINSEKFKTLIIDSNSSKDVKNIAKKNNAIFVKENDFNHGSTREKARKILKTDIVIYMTQDAKLLSEQSIYNLIGPILDNKASLAYGRQVPVENADLLESFPVNFNYPNKSNVRSIENVKEYGVGIFFCSDVFSAYLSEDLDKVGGFNHILTGEDYFMCYKLLMNNRSIAYVSDAQVIHSHNYSLIQNFKRMFDTGYVRGERKYIQEIAGHADRRGANLAFSLFKKILKEKPFILPYAILQIVFKYLGFKIGFYGTKLPVTVKRLFSEQKYFWQ